MSTWGRKQGDVNDTLVAEMVGIVDLDPQTVDSIEARVRRGSTVVDLAAAVTDPDARQVTVQLSPWLATAVLGRWELTYRLIFVDGSERTWPEGQPDYIFVGP